MAASSSQPDVVYAVTATGLYESHDRTVTWLPFNGRGLPTNWGRYSGSALVDVGGRRLFAMPGWIGGVYVLDLGMVRTPDGRVP